MCLNTKGKYIKVLNTEFKWSILSKSVMIIIFVEFIDHLIDYPIDCASLTLYVFPPLLQGKHILGLLLFIKPFLEICTGQTFVTKTQLQIGKAWKVHFEQCLTSKHLKQTPKRGSYGWTIYSQTSVTRTPMLRLPWLTRNRFLSPYEILPIAQENKYSRKVSYFIRKLYVVCTH